MPNLKSSAVPGKTKSAKRPKGRRWTHEVTVVGLGFRVKRDVRKVLAGLLDKGSIPGCRLEREPDNRADPNAIRVYLPERVAFGIQLGYLRANVAELLAPKMDSGKLAVANVVLESLDADDDYKSGTAVVTFIDVDKPAKKTAGRKPKTAKGK